MNSSRGDSNNYYPGQHHLIFHFEHPDPYHWRWYYYDIKSMLSGLVSLTFDLNNNSFMFSIISGIIMFEVKSSPFNHY